MTDTRRITKVKVNEKEKTITIAHQAVNSLGEWDDFSMKCHDAAARSFYDALAALREHVVKWCELPTTYESALKIIGVSFSYGGEDDVMGATVTARKSLAFSNAPLVLNAPHKASAPYSAGGDDAGCLTGECVKALEEVQAQAESYLDGERAQMTLPDGDGHHEEGT